MRVEDREPGEKPRRSNPTDGDAPAPTGDNPTNPPGGGGGNGGNRGGGHHGDGGGNHNGDNNPDHHRDHRHGHRDGDDDHRHHHHRHDDSSIYQNDDHNTSSNSGATSVNECDRGYDDGLYTGANDARRGQNYEPQRSHYHKRGGGGIFSIGRSDAAKQEYLECFLRGYEEGFRNYQNYFSDGRFHM